MIIRFHCSFIQVAMAILLVATSFAATSRAGQFEFDRNIVSVPGLITPQPSPVQSFVLLPKPIATTDVQELCGWVQQEVKREAEASLNDTSPALSASSVAATALAATGIQVQQFAEPFAMVGQYFESSAIERSIASVRSLQVWFADRIAKAQAERNEALQLAINEIALEEPIDATANSIASPSDLGPSILIAADTDGPSIEVTKLDPLVGGSAMVCVIEEEEYKAYDWAPRDLKLWSGLATNSRRFYPRCPDDMLADLVMGDGFDDAPDLDLEITIAASPDCLLDDWLCRINDQPIRSVLDQLTQPVTIGRQIASVFTKTEDAAIGAMVALASRLPKTDNRPSSAGSKLLARAEATEAEATEAEATVAEPATDASEAVESVATAVKKNSVR